MSQRINIHSNKHTKVPMHKHEIVIILGSVKIRSLGPLSARELCSFSANRVMMEVKLQF